MAGEKFVALEETSQEIKTAVEGVSTSVTELKEDVGDGAGTDLVTRVASLAVQVGNLQTAVESIPTSSDIATIVKNNAGGTVFKPKRAILGKTTTEYIMELSTGKTYKFLCAPSGSDGFKIAGYRANSGNISINNGKTLAFSGTQVIWLPLNQIIEIRVVSGTPWIYGVGTLYEVE